MDDLLPICLMQRLSRELDRLELLLEQVRTVETQRDALLARHRPRTRSPRRRFCALLRGIGPEFTIVLWSEGLFRHFANRRQLASYAGLAPTPWQSGAVAREQGVSKAGNARLRTTMIQLSWLWLRHQPTSALTLWFHERTKAAGGRNRRVMIVALARKLLVGLWKFVTYGCRSGGCGHERCLAFCYIADPVPRGLISLAGSRWTDRTTIWLK